MKFPARSILPCLFTMMAMLVGVYSIVVAAHGEYLFAAQLILVSMILDGLDGALARLLRGTSPFGAELDTFVDATAFGIAPAVLLYEMILKDQDIPGMMMAAAIVLAGVSRLARFRVVDPFRGQRGFLGLPITACAAWVAIFVIATESAKEVSWIDETMVTIQHGPLAAFFWSTVLAMTFLEVSHVHYSKPTRNPFTFVPFFVMLVMLFSGPRFAIPAAIIMAVYGFGYVFVAPLFRKYVLIHIPRAEEQAESPHSHS